MTSEITELLHSTKPGTDRSISLQTRLPGRFGVSLRYSSQTAAIKSLRFDLTNCTIRQARQYSGTLRRRLRAVNMHLPKSSGAVEVKTTVTYVTYAGRSADKSLGQSSPHRSRSPCTRFSMSSLHLDTRVELPQQQGVISSWAARAPSRIAIPNSQYGDMTNYCRPVSTPHPPALSSSVLMIPTCLVVVVMVLRETLKRLRAS